MTIQWFPGHMAKAIREIKTVLKSIDIILEVIDARLPLSSRNPIIDELSEGKSRILILNKADLADPSVTKQWLAYFREQGPALAIDTHDARTRQTVLRMIDAQAHTKAFKTRQLMVMGIPNVGKSALINCLSKRAIADVQDRPAVTKRQQWIALSPTLSLLDSPGILWPKFEDQTVGTRLGISGAIKDTLLHHEDLAFFLLTYCMSHYPDLLVSRYKLDRLADKPLDVMTDIGVKRGFRYKNSEIDYDKVYKTLLLEFQRGKLGRMSLEKPAEERLKS